MPIAKVTVGALAAALSGLVVLELNTRLNAHISGEEASYIATIFSFVAGYLTPMLPGEMQKPPPPASSSPAPGPSLSGGGA